jgi:hypothetical protein
MATVPSSSDKLTGSPVRIEPNCLPASGKAYAVEPPLFRFRLRHLLFFVAVVSFVLAATVLAHGVAALALLLASLVVAAHLFSTALASRLRSRADSEQAVARTMWLAHQSERRSYDHSSEIPRSVPSPWHARGSTTLPWLPQFIVAGILVGGILGATVLILTIGQRITLAGVAVGGLSSAVLGGWFAFLGGSFYGIFRHGLRDAIEEQKKDERRCRLRR